MVIPYAPYGGDTKVLLSKGKRLFTKGLSNNRRGLFWTKFERG
jgi:hypothetical protein